MPNKEHYFAGLKDQKDIKEKWRELVFKHHPDRGGDTATMQEVNDQYQKAMRGHYTAEAKAEGKDESSVDWWMEQEGMLFEIISKLMSLEGLEIELLGVWIWITGETKAHKKELGKEGIKARWSKDKKAWYWRSAEHAFRRKKAPSKSLDELRKGFDSKKVKSKRTPRLTYQG